jgi:hypothetical protein
VNRSKNFFYFFFAPLTFFKSTIDRKTSSLANKYMMLVGHANGSYIAVCIRISHQKKKCIDQKKMAMIVRVRQPVAASAH